MGACGMDEARGKELAQMSTLRKLIMSTLWPLWWCFINSAVKCFSLFSSQTVQAINCIIKTILNHSEQWCINISHGVQCTLLLCDYRAHSFIYCSFTLLWMRVRSMLRPYFHVVGDAWQQIKRKSRWVPRLSKQIWTIITFQELSQSQ